MKESTLLKIALSISIIGIAALFVLSKNIRIDDAMIGRMDQAVDEKVYITGLVLDISRAEGVTFLRLQKEEMTEIILFGETPKIGIGDMVQVKGTVTEEDGETSMIGEEVRVI